MKKWLFISLLLLAGCSDDETPVPGREWGGMDVEAELVGGWKLRRFQVVLIDNFNIGDKQYCDSLRTAPQAWMPLKRKDFLFHKDGRAEIQDYCEEKATMFSTWYLVYADENDSYTVQTQNGDYFQVVHSTVGPGIELKVTYQKYFRTVNLFYAKDW